MKMTDRPLAFTDVETTGLDPHIHEIIEIGLVLVEHKDLTVVEELNLKIKPEHIETATAEALIGDLLARPFGKPASQISWIITDWIFYLWLGLNYKIGDLKNLN